MIADFDAGPVPSNPGQPVFGSTLLRGDTGQVIAGFSARPSALFERPLRTQHDQRSGEGELQGEGFDGEGMQAADLDPAVPGLGLDKKGVFFN